MRGNHFFHFGTGTVKPKKHSWFLGLEREIQTTIPIGRGCEWENPNFIPVKQGGNGKIESALKA